MKKISIITPFSGSTSELLPDYDAAVHGAEIIIIDNASDEQTAANLDVLMTRHPGILIRNNQNIGFAPANNQGYIEATGDIIIFLNSDVAAPAGWLKMVDNDVKDGALYGPSLQAQMVAGKWLPYLEGWCVAATKKTWAQLSVRSEQQCLTSVAAGIEPHFVGPWDALHYPGPYWEDNAQCYEAIKLGFSLVQTAWPVQHKGGRTAGPIVHHADSFERNRATFAQRVLADLQAPQRQHSATYARYLAHCQQPSDIQHHLPLLYSLAWGNVLELGTRSGISTTALLAGVELRGGHVWSVDIDPNSAKVAEGHPQWTFLQGSSIEGATWTRVTGLIVNATGVDDARQIDLLFIDTLHNYTHVKDELALWWDVVRPGGYICIHDPETFPGVRRAIQEFCDGMGWDVTFVLPCNGMAVIKVP